MDVHFRYSKKNSYSFAVLSPLLPEAGFSDRPLKGIMIYSFTSHQAARAFAEVKNANTDSIFIAGGPHPSGAPEETLEYFDYVVIGEGEETLPELVKVLQAGEDPGIVRGIAYKDPSKDPAAGKIIVTPKRPHVNLDSYPCFDPEKLRSPIEISRGCPWGCQILPDPKAFRKGSPAQEHRFHPEECKYYDDLRFIASNSLAYGSDGIHPRFDKSRKAAFCSSRNTQQKYLFRDFPFGSAP